jgi:mannose/fructose/N-acetylgalactosamine-specific phosphotransferase system component IIC
MGHGIIAAALLELCLAGLGVIGAHLTVDPQHAAARPKVAVLHHGPIHSDDFFC